MEEGEEGGGGEVFNNNNNNIPISVPQVRSENTQVAAEAPRRGTLPQRRP